MGTAGGSSRCLGLSIPFPWYQVSPLWDLFCGGRCVRAAWPSFLGPALSVPFPVPFPCPFCSYSLRLPLVEEATIMAEPLPMVRSSWKPSSLGPSRLIAPMTKLGPVTHGCRHPQSHIQLAAFKSTGPVATALMILLEGHSLQLSLAPSLRLPLHKHDCSQTGHCWAAVYHRAWHHELAALMPPRAHCV